MVDRRLRTRCGLVVSMLWPAPRPAIAYVQVEPQQRSGLGCLAPLVFAGVVLFIQLALR